jgi:hypothetical protein
MRLPKTHFEQIPVETVKGIARDFPERNAMELDEAMVQPPAEVTPSREPWRELAERVQREEDPHKIVDLVQKLITTFDAERPQRRRIR